MSSIVFGYTFYDKELLVGTAASLEPYLQGQKAKMFESIDKLFQTLHPFAVNGTSICFLADARVLKAPWASYDLSHRPQPPCFHTRNAFNRDDDQQAFGK
ncbi:hypothetical protein SAMN05421781_0461 [Marinococcus luteus]|uniref:Uncharacterized protein n=1 Tax=Marinococcus luteus TaxID=1122204 RepID=A0A1H2QUA6_9BACI|nr:hypothetical protein [Marinococcus luteus]SDW10498.1 hypothetical protein SAMN05421781_0461 [Marinococcus luteus]